MSVMVYDPISKELIYTKPRGVEIPASAYDLNSPTIVENPPKSTSPLLIAIMVIIILFFILVLIYLTWLIFIRNSTDTPASYFRWIPGGSN